MIPQIPLDYLYTKSHEWVKIVGESVTIGITSFAVEQMNKDIVSVELPKVGSTFTQGDVFGVIDSVKSAFDLYSPVGFTVTEVNQQILKDPSIIADSPFESGWFLKGKLTKNDDIQNLLNYSAYQEVMNSEH